MRLADFHTKELIRLEAFARLAGSFPNYTPSQKEVDEYFNYLLDLWSNYNITFSWEVSRG